VLRAALYYQCTRPAWRSKIALEIANLNFDRPVWSCHQDLEPLAQCQAKLSEANNVITQFDPIGCVKCLIASPSLP
jgi:hypothetical protein